MNLAYPIGLFALTALVIPVLIHLWNVKQGKVLKIGSIGLLGESATASAKSLKLTDILLFILRCLILTLIAFVLSIPYFKKTNSIAKNKGWILIDKAQLAGIYSANQHTIDSLLAVGFEIRDFNLGFKPVSLKYTAKEAGYAKSVNYFGLVNQLNKEIPSTYSAYIFADQRIINFDGNLPKLKFNLIWKTTQKKDTLKTWSTTYLNKVYESKSTPSLTSYTVNKSDNLPVIKLSIYRQDVEDSKYLKAALKAITDYTGRPIEIVPSTGKANVVFKFEEGKVEDVNSTLLVFGEYNQPIELKKRIKANYRKGSVIWKDGYGEPILIKDHKTNTFYFYSHFNPQWSDLVWSELFVKALIPIIFSHDPTANFGFEDHDADQRVLDRVSFADSKLNISGFLTETSTRNLATPLWVLAFILLIIERYLSFKQQKM